MERDILRLYQLLQEGKCCTQIMVSMGLELNGQSNPQLVSVSAALCNGVRSGLVCGALTGAAMLLYLFDPENALTDMIPELSEWFEETYTEAYAGIDCDVITGKNTLNRKTRCPGIIESTYRKAREILEEFGFDVEDMTKNLQTNEEI